MRSRALSAALLTAVLVCLAPATPAAAAVPVVVLDGTGFGHGVGLSQWGAEYLARTGRSAAEILGTFYPGAGLSEASGPVRVAVHRPARSTTTLTFPQGGEVRSPLEGQQAAGFPVQVGPGGRVRITFDGSYRVDPVVSGQGASATRYASEPCSLVVLCPPSTTTPPAPTTTTPGPTTPPPPPPDGGGGDPGPGASPAPGPAPGPAASSAPVWAVPAGGGVTTVDERGRSYRGLVEATGGGGLRLVNHVDVEDYLRGMAEVPSTWPAAAVQAQTVAARTYALRAVQASGEICDDARCQVYVGAGAESPGQSAAVAATARQVVTHGGALAAAVYSADAGGVSATTAEGFGTPDGVYPYLTTVRYDTDNPLPWHRDVALTDVAGRLGYPGQLSTVTVAQAGPSGRAMDVVLEGSGGAVHVDGRRFARALGLRSTRFTLAMGSAATAPPAPPPVEEAIQALPEEAGALAREPARSMSRFGFDRRQAWGSGPTPADLPAGLDPRRHPATLVAGGLVAGLAALHGRVRTGRWWPDVRGAGVVVARWAPWRLRTRSR